MINISAKYANLLKNDEVPKELVIHFPNEEYRDLTNDDIIAESMKFVESAGDTDTIKFGISDTPCFEVDVYGVPDLSNSEIEVKLICDFSEYGGADDFEIIIGRFRIDKMTQNYNTELVHILAYSSAMVDLNAEDITQEFFYTDVSSVWRGTIEYILRNFTDGYTSNMYRFTDLTAFTKTLAEDTTAGEWKTNINVFNPSTRMYTFYWTKAVCTVRQVIYKFTVPTEEMFQFLYREWEAWQDEAWTPLQVGRIGDDQCYQDQQSWSTQGYPEPHGGYITSAWDYINSLYFSDSPDGIRYRMITIGEVGEAGYDVIVKASHCLSYAVYNGTSTQATTYNPPEPSSWTLVGSNTYPEITLADAPDIHAKRFIATEYLFGNALACDYYFYSNLRNAMAANYPSGSDGFTKAVMWNMIAECIGKMCRMNRADGSLELYSLIDADGLYPADDLYPAEDLFPRESNSYDIKLSMYEYLNYQGERSKRIGKVTVGTNGQYSAQVPDYNANEYAEITISPENIFVKGFEYRYGATSNEVKHFADEILNNYKDYEFIPYECQAVGLPFMQAGDFIVVENIEHDNKKFYIARRTLSGIQALKDDYSAGGLS